jgi:hypothetical protein
MSYFVMAARANTLPPAQHTIWIFSCRVAHLEDADTFFGPITVRPKVHHVKLLVRKRLPALA